MPSISEITVVRDKALEEAKRFDYMLKRGEERMLKFPFWKRLLVAWRFRRIKKKLDNYMWARFGAMSIVMGAQRQIKAYRRAKKCQSQQ